MNAAAMLKISCICLFCLCLALPIDAQQGQRGATATPEVPTSGTPSTIQIKRNFLNQQIRAVNSQIQVAQRCIVNASRSQVLRDPQGNINLVPSQDIVNCSRTLAALQRQLASLSKQAAKLAQDAQVQAAALQARQKQLQSQKQSSQRRRIIRGKAL
jgi:hypothetical protein